jgi:hypothetical protein
MTKGKLMRDLYDSFLESGIGRASFCAMHQINVHTFKYWQRKFESADGHRGFVSVVVGSECLYQPDKYWTEFRDGLSL